MSTRGAIEEQYPNMLRSSLDGYVFAHYCYLGEQMFCLVKDQWWELDIGSYDVDYGEEGVYTHYFVERATKVDAPEGAVYSHTVVFEWDMYCPKEVLFAGDEWGNNIRLD